MLDGHSLDLKISKKNTDIKVEQQAKGTKLIIKNVPFEATKKDIREIFRYIKFLLSSAYGQVKSVRLPNKFGGGHRGFAFVDFFSKNDAKNVIINLSNTHLYGRHLVVSYADTEVTDINSVKKIYII